MLDHRNLLVADLDAILWGAWPQRGRFNKTRFDPQSLICTEAPLNQTSKKSFKFVDHSPGISKQRHHADVLNFTSCWNSSCMRTGSRGSWPARRSCDDIGQMMSSTYSYQVFGPL